MSTKVRLEVKKELSLHLQLAHQIGHFREMGLFLLKEKFYSIDIDIPSFPDPSNTVSWRGQPYGDGPRSPQQR